MDKQADALIIGGGPAGATAALRLLARGIRPLIVERERFPRYHIGESMTGECGAIVRSLGLEQRMAADKHPVKHGVRVFGARGASDWWLPVMQRTEGVLHEQVTWQVRRSDFDAMLLEEAERRGAERLHGRALAPIAGDDGVSVSGATVQTPGGASVRVRAGITLDCSGQATFLASHKVTGPKYLGAYDKQIAIFSQVANYARDTGGARELEPGNTHIFYTRKYHWGWAIPIDARVTSVGIVVPANTFREAGQAKEAFYRAQLRELNAGLAARIGEPELVEPVHVIPNYSFQVQKFAGPGYICVGDAHRFVDPIFSFGLYVAMKEAGLAAEAAAAWLAGKGRDAPDPFREHRVRAEAAIDELEDAVDAFWENPLAFAVLVHRRYREALIDLFAGRIYEGMPSRGRDVAMAAFRRLLGRERSYREDDPISVPIGSRFRPERAPLWNSTLDSVQTTERWMRELDG